jgi:hypothetical protein
VADQSNSAAQLKLDQSLSGAYSRASQLESNLRQALQNAMAAEANLNSVPSGLLVSASAAENTLAQSLTDAQTACSEMETLRTYFGLDQKGFMKALGGS